MARVIGGRSIKLANVLGVRIGVDPTWFFVLFLLIWMLSTSNLYRAVDSGGGDLAFVLATASALLFFGSVILHELGHAIVARRNGIAIAGIDLWLFGGMARMRRDAGSPGVEFRIAVAGPLVTVVVIVLCAAGAVLFGGGVDELRRPDRSPDAAFALLGFLAYVNTLLLVFNLLPGLPLDGGRIVRALVWKLTGDRLKATRAAGALGRGFGIVVAGAGVFLLFPPTRDPIGGIWLIFIGFFLAQAARATVTQTAVATRIEGLRVADVMDDDPVALPSSLPLARASDEFFLRYGWPWFPVVDDGGRFAGLLRRDQVDLGGEDDGRTVGDLLDPGTRERFGVHEEEPLETLLGSEGLQQLGALAAVDRDGVLRGVVTVERVRRALGGPPSTPDAGRVP